MLKHLLLCAALTTPALAGGIINSQSEYGTPEEAQAMLTRAIGAVKADKTAAINRFNHNDPSFRDRDLFVFCFNSRDGKLTAHEDLSARTYAPWSTEPVSISAGKCSSAR